MTVWDQKLVLALLTVIYAGGLRIGEVTSSGGSTQHTIKVENVSKAFRGNHLVAYILCMESFKQSFKVEWQQRSGFGGC